MGLEVFIIALGAVAAFSEIFGNRAAFILDADDHDLIECEGAQ
jgi:hypothetical protein